MPEYTHTLAHSERAPICVPWQMWPLVAKLNPQHWVRREKDLAIHRHATNICLFPAPRLSNRGIYLANLRRHKEVSVATSMYMCSMYLCVSLTAQESGAPLWFPAAYVTCFQAVWVLDTMSMCHTTNVLKWP